MDTFNLEIAAMAAKSNFKKTELMGEYHNECLFYVIEKQKNSAKPIDNLIIQKWVIQYLSNLPIGAFDNLTQLEVKNLSTKILNEINLETVNTPFDWKNNSKLSIEANKSIIELFQLMESFLNSSMTPKKGKLLLENWQKLTLKKKLTKNEKILIAGAGAVSRYSLAFWLLNGPNNKTPISNMRRASCEKKVEIPVAARDVMGAIMGGLIGFGFAGPSGAIVGVVAGGTLASAT
jgi:hypothetical protein